MTLPQAASSSRSQVLRLSAWGKDPDGLRVLSTCVRWRLLVFAGIVTQSVTHPAMQPIGQVDRPKLRVRCHVLDRHR
jgi:hypothetical protein